MYMHNIIIYVGIIIYIYIVLYPVVKLLFFFALEKIIVNAHFLNKIDFFYLKEN
jgi:hypothetical protein